MKLTTVIEGFLTACSLVTMSNKLTMAIGVAKMAKVTKKITCNTFLDNCYKQNYLHIFNPVILVKCMKSKYACLKQNQRSKAKK